MKLLIQRILRDGEVLPGNILKVDSFLNHQLDVGLIDAAAEEICEKYKDRGITKVLTVEASGIPIACSCARVLGVPALFAKKARSRNLDSDLYTFVVHSYTYGQDYTICVAKKFLGKEDTVLLVDDFLADGKAMRGLLEICAQAGAKVAGIGVAIEKGFQEGGRILRTQGYDLTSLAIVQRMDEDGNILFREID